MEGNTMSNVENVEIGYFSGYTRNYKNLCAELEIAETENRAVREELILKKAYSKWQMDMMNHIYGAFAVHIKASYVVESFLVGIF